MRRKSWTTLEVIHLHCRIRRRVSLDSLQHRKRLQEKKPTNHRPMVYPKCAVSMSLVMTFAFTISSSTIKLPDHDITSTVKQRNTAIAIKTPIRLWPVFIVYAVRD